MGVGCSDLDEAGSPTLESMLGTLTSQSLRRSMYKLCKPLFFLTSHKNQIVESAGSAFFRLFPTLQESKP